MKFKDGSSLLLVLLITSILSFLALGLWYKSSLYVDLVLQEEQYYKNFYLVESFLDYGIQYAKENFNEFINSKDLPENPIVFTLNLAETLDSHFKNLLIEINIKRLKEKDKIENKLFICALLKDINRSHQIFKLSCKLLKVETKNGSEKNKRQAEFFVENFTVGNFV